MGVETLKEKSKPGSRQSCIWLTAFIVALVFCLFTAVYPISAKAASAKNVKIKVGESYTLSIKNAPSKLKWSSNKKSVVKIKSVSGSKNNKAVIYGVKKGKAVVTAKAGNSTLKANVTVEAVTPTKPAKPVTPVTPGAGSYKTTINANPNYEKAPKMRRDGTYNVNAKKNYSYVRFIAPSSGTWTITISNIRDWGKSSAKSENLGNLYVHNGKMFQKAVTTQGGKAECLWTGTNAKYVKYLNSGSKTIDKYLPSRKCVVKLKKGQSIYFQYYYTGGACQYTFTVKK